MLIGSHTERVVMKDFYNIINIVFGYNFTVMGFTFNLIGVFTFFVVVSIVSYLFHKIIK